MTGGQQLLFGLPDDHAQKPPTAASILCASQLPALHHLAARLPRRLLLGTSSWAFPGWQNLVYAPAPSGKPYNQARLAAAGLNAYSAHPLLRAVGFDRAFYRPPSLTIYRTTAEQVPADFRFLVKAFQGITRPFADSTGHTHGPADQTHPNPLFLDAQFAAEQVITPAAVGLGPRLGVVVLQFPPLTFIDTPRHRAAALHHPAAFLERLDAFCESLRARLVDAAPTRMPTPLPLAIELRNRIFFDAPFARRYAALLARHAISHVYTAHPSVPSLAAQHAALSPSSTASPTTSFNGLPLIMRWMLRSNHHYTTAKDLYAPFNTLAEEDPEVRAVAADLIALALRQERDCIVIINNKAEGCAPLSCVALAQQVVARLEASAAPPQFAPGSQGGPTSQSGSS